VLHGVLVGSVAAIVLLGVATAVVVQRAGPTEGALPHQHLAALAPGGPASGVGEPPQAKPAPQPSRPIPPSFDIVKVGPTGTAVIAGRAEAGSKVSVHDGDKVIGEVTADRRGEWVLVPDQPIGPGDRLLSLEASNGRGGAAVKSDETVALSVGPATGGRNAETALAVVLPRDGAGAARVLQRPDRSPPGAPATDSPTAVSMDTVEYDEQGRVVLSGHARPGAKVQIYLGEEPVANATADTAGGWSATANEAIGPGRHELRLDLLGEDRQVVERLSLPLARAEPTDLAPGQNYVVQPGNNLWQIARRTYGDGVRYLIIYAANMERIHDPERIYPGQVFKLPKS
jgi:nucleoid-associated protein YgaU